MQSHSDILDEAICALCDGDRETYHAIIIELQGLHNGQIEVFNRWLRRKLSECLEALEFTLKNARDAAQKDELTRRAAVLRSHLENFATNVQLPSAVPAMA